MDKIQSYRQPMVTATGIILGFLLSIAGSWAGKAFSTHRFTEMVTAMFLCVQFPLFIIVLYRILNMNYPAEKADAYYKTTLRLFVAGLLVAYIGIVTVVVESFFWNRIWGIN
jgi:hypothetical protein